MHVYVCTHDQCACMRAGVRANLYGACRTIKGVLLRISRFNFCISNYIRCPSYLILYYYSYIVYIIQVEAAHTCMHAKLNARIYMHHNSYLKLHTCNILLKVSCVFLRIYHKSCTFLYMHVLCICTRL